MMQPIRSGKTGSLPQSNPPGWRPLPINDSSRPSVEQSRNVVTGAVLNTFDSKLSANALLLHRKQVEELKHFSLNNCFNSSVESNDRPAPGHDHAAQRARNGWRIPNDRKRHRRTTKKERARPSVG